MDDIIKIVMPLEDSGLLIDGATESVKQETKKQEGCFSWGYDSTSGFLIDTACGFLMGACYIWKRTRR